MNTDFLHGIEVVEIDDGARPIRTLKSSVIGLVGTAGKGAANTPILTTSFRDAVTKFGGWDTSDGFTIPQSLKSIYDEFKATCVVVNVINVADVASLAVVAAEPKTFPKFSDVVTLNKRFVSAVLPAAGIKVLARLSAGPTGTIVLPAGITGVTSVKSSNGGTTYTAVVHYTYLNGVITRVDVAGAPAAGSLVEVTYTANLVEGTDYTVEPATGAITRLPTGSKIMPQATITWGYKYVDPTTATATDIIGGVDEITGVYTGTWALLSAQTTLKLKPRILLAPGFTHQKPDANQRNAVTAALDTIAARIGAITLADGPNTTDEAAALYAADWGSARIMVLDPFVTVMAPSGVATDVPYSSTFAGLMAATDAEYGFWASPSNKLIKGIIGTARPIEFALNDPNSRANYLNEHNVTTVVHEQGFRSWGNRTTSSDPKWSFLNVRRGADIVQESILFAHLWAVDRNITKGFVDAVVQGVNDYLRYLKGIGAILGGEAWADPDLNTPSVVAAGQLFIDFDFTIPYVAERITFRAHLVNKYVTEVFD